MARVSDETPYPDKDFTDREQWAEVEAQQCIKTAQALEECIPGWLVSAAKSGNHPDPFHEAHICAIKAQTWRELADQLRRPRIIRIEMDRRGY